MSVVKNTFFDNDILFVRARFRRNYHYRPKEFVENIEWLIGKSITKYFRWASYVGNIYFQLHLFVAKFVANRLILSENIFDEQVVENIIFSTRLCRGECCRQ